MDCKTLAHYFHLLGLEPGASLSDVKEAYRFLAQTFHPDKYLADHPFRERARNKMVELNNAYDVLKEFFRENPNGAPEGGWKTETNKEEYSCDDSMDWQSWQRDQQDSWESELKEWHEQELKRRSNLKVEEEKKKRQLVVKVSRFGLAAAFLCLFMGHSGSHQMHQVTNGFSQAVMSDKLRYDLATHGTANGAYSMSDAQIIAQDAPGIVRQERAGADESSKDSTSLLLLLLVGAGIGWLLFSKKGQTHTHNWVNSQPQTAKV